MTVGGTNFLSNSHSYYFAALFMTFFTGAAEVFFTTCLVGLMGVVFLLQGHPIFYHFVVLINRGFSWLEAVLCLVV